jgi:hypothetical protein
MSDDFPVEFAEPSHAELNWEWDDMHMPFALTPLAADYVRTLGGGFNDPYVRLGFPQRSHFAVWNGYAYFGSQPNASDEERPAIRERFTEACRQRAEVTARYWADEAIPELLGLYGGIEAIVVDELSGAGLATAWASAWAATLRAWEIHFYAILGPYQVVEDLADAYQAAIEGAPAGEALRLIQGFSPDLFDRGRTAAGDRGSASFWRATDVAGAGRALGRRGVRGARRCVSGAAWAPRPGVRRPRPAVLHRGAEPAAGRDRQATRSRAGRRRGPTDGAPRRFESAG